MQSLACTLLIALSVVGAANGATPDWTDFLRRDSVERIQISPDGTRLALAERKDGSTVVTVRDATSMQVQTTLNPGAQGEVATLRWLDDERLLVGASRADTRYKVTLVRPAHYIVGRDGKSKYVLPGNFLSTIDGDPEHLLVSTCRNWQDGGCIDEVRRAEIGHLARLGDKIIAAPDVDAELWPDRHGNVRFAVAWDDESKSKLHVHRSQDAGWTLVNDSKQSGVDVLPLGMSQDGTSAYFVSERKSGPSVVERYEMDSGKREDVYRHADSDPLWTIHAFDGVVPIGAYYQATQPRPVIWNADHPDVPALHQILSAFPGKVVQVTSASRDRSRAIVSVKGDRDPGSFYLFDRTNNRATLLARRRPWLGEETALPASREVSLTARDGTPLKAVLTLPAGAAATQALPLVVVPHGGPYEVMDIAVFDPETSLLASQGYAVLRVNFRGSGGYGRQFVESGHMQWGRAMQDDVTDATRWAIAAGIADPQRICLYGASYGGYSALMGAIRESTLYRCVAGYAAPYDLAKMYKWGSIRRSDLGLNYLKRVIGKDPADLAARSPVKQAEAIKVPVLLAHGRLDARVDVDHSRTMVKALRKAGVDIELVEYPNEGHGLAIEADQADFYRRLLAFLQENTQPR